MKRSAEELLRAFAQLTHMSISLYDRDFHGLIGTSCCPSVPVCTMIHRSDFCLGKCIESDRAARKACPESGEAYAYICPFGMCEIIVALRQDGTTVGYLLAGKSLPTGQDAERQMMHAVTPYLSEIASSEAFAELIGRLPRYTAEEYNRICCLLEVLANALAEDDQLLRTKVSLAQLVYRYLKKNYHAKITLPELSMLFHCNTVTMSESFRKEYGKTIIAMLNEIRLSHAKKLLVQTDLSLEEIAERCGFSERRYFTRCFGRDVGYSPSQWRQLQQAESSKISKERGECESF